MIKILIIDDDPSIQILLKRTLISQGYDVSLAKNGREGFQLAQNLRPALIICDWIMPGEIDGLEVCRRVKSSTNLSTTFFILLTSLDSVADRVKGLDAGSDDFLCKPIDMYELKARVRAGLRTYQLTEDLQQQKKLLEAELQEAADYVSSILPQPLQHEALKIDARFIPSRQLGGDSFDYYWLDAKHLVMYLLDVSGHGLRASLPSVSIINLLRSRGINRVNYYRPSEVLKGLNETFKMTEINDKYFTIWYGVYNIKKRELVYANAGHPPAIALNPNLQEHTLKAPGVPIGMFEQVEYKEQVCKILPQSSLYIFSDGIYEIDTSASNRLNYNNFLLTLKKYHLYPERNLDLLLKLIREMNNHKQQFDDDLSIIQIDFT